MENITIKQLKELILWAKEQGIRTFKYQGLEVEFGPEGKEVSAEDLLDEELKTTKEDELFWSA